MSNHVRKVVFLALLAVFFVSGIPLVLFAAGYRLLPNSLSITRSGGLYVKSVPQDAQIYIDEKHVPNNSGILNSGTFVTGITPGKYDLRVEKDGYYPFEAVAEINPLQADSFEKLILAPTDYASSLRGDIKDFYAEGGETIIKESSGRLRYKGQIITGEDFEFLSADRKSLVTSSLINNQRFYFLISLSNLSASTNINEVFWNLKSSKLNLPGQVPIVTMAPYPYDGNKVILSTKAAFYIMDLKSLDINISEEKAEKIIQENYSVFTIRNNGLFEYNTILKSLSPIMDIFGSTIISISPSGRKIGVLWLDKTLEIYDLDLKRSLRFNLNGLGEIKNIFWHKSSGYVFIQSDNSLYYLYVEKENIKPQLIYEGLKKADYSDGRLFVLGQTEIKTSKF
jgi:hypothetical protein